VISFLEKKRERIPTVTYLHVGREEEVDFRTLYSEWLAECLFQADEILDFSSFRQIALNWLKDAGDV